tara:strand:+ start:87 stop:968 length:882 start_codon:yes stop_codon:yes gene_type:complete
MTSICSSDSSNLVDNFIVEINTLLQQQTDNEKRKVLDEIKLTLTKKLVDLEESLLTSYLSDDGETKTIEEYDPETTLFVKPGLNSLKKALIEAEQNTSITIIVLENGIHKIETYNDEEWGNRNRNMIDIDIPITIIGESRINCIVIGGFNIKGNVKNTVSINNMTIRESLYSGVEGFSKAASFLLDNVCIDRCAYHGVSVSETNRNQMTNCEISNSGDSGLRVYDGTILIKGKKTTIHHNRSGNKGRSFYGMKTSTSSSIIQLIAPLTKESISTDNGGGGNWGGEGTIVTIEQ